MKKTDQVLLNGRECDYSYAVPAEVFVRKTAFHLGDYRFGFGAVLLGFSLVVNAWDVHPIHLGNLVGGGRERQQLIVAELCVAERDKAHMPRAVVPQQVFLRHSQRKAAENDDLALLHELLEQPLDMFGNRRNASGREAPQILLG